MSQFKKGQSVVRLIIGAGCETASITKVESVRKGEVKVEDSDVYRYDANTGKQTEDLLFGFTSRLIVLEG